MKQLRISAALTLAMLFAFASPKAHAVGCLEPCAQGEMYSDDAEMCVAIDTQAWS